MGKVENIQTIVNELHAINFKKIIVYDNYDINNPESFAFDPKQENFKQNVKDYCKECNRESSYCPYDDKEKDQNYKLNNISHGSHTVDFLRAFGLAEKTIWDDIMPKWNDDPVLFLMENPSVGNHYDYITEEENGDGKRPAKDWYWIHNSLKDEYEKKYFDGDRYFVQSHYGKMVASLIKQFKLGNAYLTNLVKCGISDARIENGVFIENGYKNLEEYSRECIYKCVESVLYEEIKVLCESFDGPKLKPLRIFAFGDRPYNIMRDVLRNKGDEWGISYKIYQLPHPASREKNSYRKYILKGAVEDSFKNDNQFDSSNSFLDIDSNDVKEVFKNTSFGKKVKMSKHYSKYAEKELIDEVWINGNKTEKVDFNWGIGFVFETDSFWYWDYEKSDSVNRKDILFSEEFENAIFKLKKLNELRKTEIDKKIEE